MFDYLLSGDLAGELCLEVRRLRDSMRRIPDTEGASSRQHQSLCVCIRQRLWRVVSHSVGTFLVIVRRRLDGCGQPSADDTK